MDNMLESSVIYLIQKERFYAELLLRMRRNYRTDIPTAGVSITDSINLFVNPTFWKSLSIKEQASVLKHECHHILNNHMEREKVLEPNFNRIKANEKKSIIDRIKDMQDATRLNQAEDYAINEYLPDLPDSFNMFDEEGNIINNPETGKPEEFFTCKVKKLKEVMPDTDVLNRQGMEYYYSILKQDEKKNGGQGQPMIITIDDHSLWEEGNPDEEYSKEIVKGIVKQAVEACGGRDAGCIPGELLTLIDELNYTPKNWRQDIHKFTANCSEMKVEETRKRRNRRYGTMYPGNRFYPELNLCVAIDTSGSVGDQELQQFVAELHGLHKLDVNIVVLMCDTEINDIFRFDPRKKIECKGRGGTSFAPVFNKLKDPKFIAEYGEVDGLIYLTDGENYDTEDVKEPKFKVLWALLENCNCHYKWGYKTEIKIRKK